MMIYVKGVAKKSRHGFLLIASMIFVLGEIYLYQQKIDLKSFPGRYITLLYSKNCRSKVISYKKNFISENPGFCKKNCQKMDVKLTAHHF